MTSVQPSLPGFSLEGNRPVMTAPFVPSVQVKRKPGLDKSSVEAALRLKGDGGLCRPIEKN